jgi:hypothetical protein
MTDPFEEFERMRRLLQPIEEAEKLRRLSEPSAVEQQIMEEARRMRTFEPSAAEQQIMAEVRRMRTFEPSAVEQQIVDDARRFEDLRRQSFDADAMLGTLSLFRPAIFDFAPPALDAASRNVEPRESANARQSVTQLIQEIKDFEQELDADREVGVCFVSAGGSDVVHVTSVRFSPPNLVVFGGYTDAGLETRVIHHISQTRVQLVAVPVLGEKKRIGFSIGPVDGDD